MEKKLKLCYAGHRSLLFSSCPAEYSALISTISNYYKLPQDYITIYYEDNDKDQCQILDQATYDSAKTEGGSKIKLSIQNKELLPRFLCRSKVKISNPTLKYFKSQSSLIGVYDLCTNTTEWVKFSSELQFKKDATWVEIPNGDILYCGGLGTVSSSSCYLINIKTLAYTKLDNMINSRHSNGILLKNGYVYVLGGTQKNFYYSVHLKNCERYSLENQTWQEIYELAFETGQVAVCNADDRLLVTGKGYNFIEELGRDVLLDFGDDSGGSMTIYNDKLYIFRGSFLKIYENNTWVLIQVIRLPYTQSWWTHTPPVVYNEAIYFLWNEDNGWVCKYDLITQEFNKVYSFVIN
jgi:Kelch motif